MRNAALLSAIASASVAAGCASNVAVAEARRPSSQPNYPEAEGFLRWILAGHVFSPEKIDYVRYNLGVDRTCELVKPRFDAVLRSSLQEWQRQYGIAYRRIFPQPELEAIAQDVQARAVQLKPHLQRLMLAVMYDSLDYVDARATEVLQTATVEAAKVDFDKIDYDGRTEEIRKAESANRQACGLISSSFEIR